MKRKRVVKILWIIIVLVGTLSMVFFSLLGFFGLGAGF
jgi:hypothetical protein